MASTLIQTQTPDQIQVLLSCPSLGLPSRFLPLPLHLPFELSIPRTLNLDPSSFFLSSSGRPLPLSSSPSSSLLRPLSHLLLLPRLPGGGGDGGATGAESRDCYLHMYSVKKPDKVDPNESRLCRWTTCALSFEPLNPPCVVDRLGSVFNKESLLHALLNKSLPTEFRHIRGMKGMIPVELCPIPGSADRETHFQCPITGLEFNGKYPFFALRGCGHVVSAKALKEVKSSACLVCHREFAEDEKLVINGSKEEVEVLRERMECEKGRKKEKGSGGGAKRAVTENCRKEADAKRFKAVDIAPVHANKEVYASIFTSSKKGEIKETYMCRSLPLGRN